MPDTASPSSSLSALTSDEQEAFTTVLETIAAASHLAGDEQPLACVRAMFKGQEVAVITCVRQADDGDYILNPLAIVVTDAVFGQLDPGS